MTTPIANGETGLSVRNKLNAIIAKVDGIEDNATADQDLSGYLTTSATLDAIADGTTNRVFTDAEKTLLGNQSGTNTGDQDLSGYQLQPAEGAFVDGDKTKLDNAVESTDVSTIVKLSQAEYDALTPDAATLYVII
jgi:hypothetical protein